MKLAGHAAATKFVAAMTLAALLVILLMPPVVLEALVAYHVAVT